MADWEEVAFSHRNVHNRSGKQGRRGAGKASTGFDAQKTFGTYEVKCPAAAKIAASRSKDASTTATLEVYTLNEQGDALLAELHLPNVLHASVLLAGSRKVMNRVVRDIQRTDLENDSTDREPETAETETVIDRVEANHDQSDGEIDSQTNQSPERGVQAFEKNSFRSPKFWLRYQGEFIQLEQKQDPSESVEESGYIIFAGNDCARFQGTINCQQLGWDNVKINGWKTATKSARDFNMEWR